MGIRGVLDMCLCLGCGGVGGLVGEWGWGLGPGSGGVGWCFVCVSCESGFFCRWQVSVYCARQIDLFVCSCRTWICLYITRFL